MFLKNYKWEKKVRLLGIALSGFSDVCDTVQLSVFDDMKKRDKIRDLERAQDKLKEKYGYSCIKRAVLCNDEKCFQLKNN